MFTLVASCVCPTPDLCFFIYPSLSLVKSISINSTTQSSFSVSCTRDTSSISATKTTGLESSSNPDSVVAFFKNNGFSDSDISKIIRALPRLLQCSVDKILKPKFEFFKSQGITGSDFADVVRRYPLVLGSSLDKKIMPCFDVIRSFVHTDAKLLALIKRSPEVLMRDPHKILLPNVALLRASGVPADNIVKLLMSQPWVFLIPPSRLSEIVEEVKLMKFDPSRYLFLLAIRALSQMSRSTLEAKFNVYKKWGYSEDEVQLIFRKSPQCMMLSEKNIMSTMNFFVNEIGFAPSLIAKCPAVLQLSLSKRIIPRCSVIQILKTKGLVGNIGSLSFLKWRKEVFLKKYVFQFENEVLELLCAYQGKGR